MLIQAYCAVTADRLKSICRKASLHLRDSRKLVRAGTRATFEYVAAEPTKARLMFIEAQSVRGQSGRVYVDSMSGFVELLRSFTKPVLSAGSASEAGLRVMARGAVGALMHLFQGCIASAFLQPVDELVDGTERMFAGIGREWVVPVGRMEGSRKVASAQLKIDQESA